MTPHPGPQLAKLMDQEIEAAQALLDTLQAESEALGRDPEALEQAALRKQSLVTGMESLHQKRCTLLQSAGCAPTRSGLEDFLARFDLGGRLQQRWQRLLDLTHRCRDVNLSNGAAVEMSRLHLRQALAIIHGQSPQTVTYGASGESQATATGRVLAKA